MMRRILLLAPFLAVLAAGCTDPEFASQPPRTQTPTTQTAAPPSQPFVIPANRDVPYVATPHETVAVMLDLAEVGKDDLLYDLGSGDGRIVIAAAKRGARGVGVDIDPERIAEANENARRASVTDRVRFVEGDLFQTDLRTASAVTLYLLPSVNLRLRPKLLRELRPGTPVVSHDFDMADWEPDAKVAPLPDEEVFLWIVPARADGAWTLSSGTNSVRRLNLKQRFQRLSGSLGGTPIEDAGLRGDTITFEHDGRQYRGRIFEDQMRGTFLSSAAKESWTAQRVP